MVADSTSGPAGVWAAGIQVEAAANPKESSPWLPAPASTGLRTHTCLLGTRTRGEHERRTNTRHGLARIHARARIIPFSPKYVLLLSGTDATPAVCQRRDAPRIYMSEFLL